MQLHIQKQNLKHSTHSDPYPVDVHFGGLSLALALFAERVANTAKARLGGVHPPRPRLCTNITGAGWAFGIGLPGDRVTRHGSRNPSIVNPLQSPPVRLQRFWAVGKSESTISR